MRRLTVRLESQTGAADGLRKPEEQKTPQVITNGHPKTVQEHSTQTTSEVKKAGKPALKSSERVKLIQGLGPQVPVSNGA